MKINEIDLPLLRPNCCIGHVPYILIQIHQLVDAAVLQLLEVLALFSGKLEVCTL